MALSTSDLISRVRTAIDDVAGGKSIFKENLARSRFGNQVGGGNVAFQLNNTRVVAGTLSVSKDGGSFAAAATEDDLRGRFTFASAPATAALATYDFLFFTDAEITTLLENSASFVGTTDATFATVDPGLGDALVYKAASDAARALVTRTAPYYDAGAGGKSARKGAISPKYAALAKDLLAAAVAERLAFYGERKGAASAPAYGSVSPKSRNVTPYTPQR